MTTKPSALSPDEMKAIAERHERDATLRDIDHATTEWRIHRDRASLLQHTAWAADRIKELEAERENLRAALLDMHSGWKYIRSHHGDLPGVGWDRCDRKARAVLEPRK